MGTRAVVAVAVIGYLPVRAETGEAGPVGLSNDKVTTIRHPVRRLLLRSAKARGQALREKCSKSPISGGPQSRRMGYAPRPDRPVLAVSRDFVNRGLG